MKIEVRKWRVGLTLNFGALETLTPFRVNIKCEDIVCMQFSTEASASYKISGRCSICVILNRTMDKLSSIFNLVHIHNIYHDHGYTWHFYKLGERFEQRLL